MRRAPLLATALLAVWPALAGAQPAPGTPGVPGTRAPGAPGTPSSGASGAQSSGASGAQSPGASGAMLLTIFFRHDQSKTLNQINDELAAHHFYERFPPPGVEVVSWYVMMGIGQVITLRFPAERLREVNRVVEETAWGPYRTEFFPTYDYRAAGEAEAARRRSHQ